MLYEQGVERTTLAEVAKAADVAPGNVYYYFKTKDDLVEAAISAHGEDVRATLAAFETHRTPKARLRALVRMFADQREQVAAARLSPGDALLGARQARRTVSATPAAG